MNAPAASPLPSSPPLAALDVTPLLPIWNPFFSVSASAGYKDNVLLGRQAVEKSGFMDLAADLILWRRPVEDGREFLFSASGSDRRYWADRSVGHEEVALGRLQYSQEFRDTWEWVTEMEGSYFDQVLDVSTLDTEAARERLQGGTITGFPALRRKWAATHWIQLNPVLSRTWLAVPFDDYTDMGGQLTFRRGYRYKSEWKLDYTYRRRSFDSRQEADLSGLPVAGSSLSYERHELQWTSLHTWDAARRWRTGTRVGGQRSQDNASGYFDYWKASITGRVVYRGGRWELMAEGGIAYFDFPHQRSSADPNQKRLRSDFTGVVRAERRLGKDFKWIAEYHHDTAAATDPFEDFTANTISAGIAWEF